MKFTASQAAGFVNKPDAQMRAILLYGPNGAAVREAGARLEKWALGPDADPLNQTLLFESALLKDGARLGDALAAQSLLGGPCLVRLRIDGEAAAPAILDAAAMLESGEGRYALLLIEAGDLPRHSKIRAAFDAGKFLASLPFYEDSDQDLLRMAKSRLREAAVPISEAALAQFAQRIGDDRGLLQSELDKLITFSGPQHLGIESGDVSALMAIDGESDVDDAVQSALLGHGAEATQALSDLIGFAGVSALRALEFHLLRLQEALALLASGLAPQAIGKRLRPIVLFKHQDSFEAQLRLWSPALLGTALDAVWRAQLRAMTAGAPQELIAVSTYRVVAGIAARAGSARA